jgi:hypothetical protein
MNAFALELELITATKLSLALCVCVRGLADASKHSVTSPEELYALEELASLVSQSTIRVEEAYFADHQEGTE